MRTELRSPIVLTAFLVLLCPALGTWAQTDVPTGAAPVQPDNPPPAQKSREVNFLFSGAYADQFSADIDNGGDFSVTRFIGELAVQTNLSDDFEMSIRFNYGVNSYDFSNGALGAPATSQPWEVIQTLNFGAIFTYTLTDRWSIFGGPVLQSARESGADWGDSFIGGGVLGASYRFTDDLTLGGGLIVVSQIEDDPRLSPIVIVHWKINDSLSLENRIGSSASGQPGIELIYAPLPQWEFAVGGSSQFARFRLDDAGIAPNGVGQDEGTPFWLRVGYIPSPRVHIEGVAGLLLGGKLRLEDSNGNRITTQNYDSPLFVGLFGSVRF